MNHRVRAGSAFFVAWHGLGRQQSVRCLALNAAAALTEMPTHGASKAPLDHREIGSRQRLYFMHPCAPAAPFFLPHGTRVLGALENLMRRVLRADGFEEVVTPLLFRQELWRTSGHWDNYQDDMFHISSGKVNNADSDSVIEGAAVNNECTATEYSLKPMNCPAHCLVYAHQQRSIKELPMRLADFGVLHRNERTGGFGGLTRVRCFRQDDGHIFCTREQVHDEVARNLALMRCIYQLFGLHQGFRCVLATRPQGNTVGIAEEWADAECVLRSALDGAGLQWEEAKGDGAFYGPKIDIRITDALGRTHQTATIQLDFQLPQRFDLKYFDGAGATFRPVIIHRAMLGSFERTLALLAEHYQGIWPFFLSPRQVAVIPVSNVFAEYASEIASRLRAEGVHASADLIDDPLGRRIARARAAQFNYTAVVGPYELETRSVALKPLASVAAEEDFAGFRKYPTLERDPCARRVSVDTELVPYLKALGDRYCDSVMADARTRSV